MTTTITARDGDEDGGAARSFARAIFGRPKLMREPEEATAEHADGLQLVRAVFGDQVVENAAHQVVEPLPNHVPAEHTNPALPTGLSEVQQLFQDLEDQENYNLRRQ